MEGGNAEFSGNTYNKAIDEATINELVKRRNAGIEGTKKYSEDMDAAVSYIENQSIDGKMDYKLILETGTLFEKDHLVYN
jgi:hypothetical protein